MSDKISMHLLQNLLDNYSALRSDFVGFTINFFGIGQFLLHLFVAIVIFLIFYLLGERIKNLFFKANKRFEVFISIALGYIVVGTGIGILGVFSLLQINSIWIYLIAVTLIAIYPFYLIPNIFRKVFAKYGILKTFVLVHSGLAQHNKKGQSDKKNNFVIFGVLLFVTIAFFRLITPEIIEDGYHTDLPTMYLKSHTSMIESREMLHVIPYSQLPEMIYLIPIVLGDKEAARFIQFGFYLLLIALVFRISQEKKNSFTKYVPLLFVTTPGVIKYASSQYTDFFAIFPMFLSVALIDKNITKKNLILAGVLFGAVVSAKIWMLVYLPVAAAYLLLQNRHMKKIILLQLLGIFLLSSVVVPLVWYIRAYILTGNPIFPIINTYFMKLQQSQINPFFTASASGYIGFNWEMFTFQNLVILSPLFFLGIILSVFNFPKFIAMIKHSSFFLLFSLFTLEQLVIHISWGRYLLIWFIASAMIVSAGIVLAFDKSKYVRYFFIASFFGIFLYYLLNTLFILPYGFGWADKNAYMTRVLSRDNVSYYDFDHLFGKWTTDNDLVATYGIGSYYYANFSYIDVGYIFSNENKSFTLLKKNHVTRLFIKGGDITWFCMTLKLTNCETDKTKLLATFPSDTKKYNLYSIK